MNTRRDRRGGERSDRERKQGCRDQCEAQICCDGQSLVVEDLEHMKLASRRVGIQEAGRVDPEKAR